MCQPASMVLTKDYVLWSMNTDSHTDICEEFGLHEDGARGPNVLKIEITPPDGDFAAPAEKWIYRLDQDIMPAWYDAVRDEARGRVALVDWINKRVIREGAKKLCSGRFFITGGIVKNVCGSATVKNVCGSATVKNVCGSATVKNVCGSATVKNVCGSATVKNVCGSATVENVCGSATVKNICGSATVIQYGGTCEPPKDNAVVIDRRKGKPFCITFDTEKV